ncbi:MAG: hypothetical protein J6V63_05610 [Spirochaetaceae bacterium]|nr:hypothetical protein [Spirochaetaceae bacterium]
MKIFINGQEADITLDSEKNLGDVLTSFESECAKNKATTVNIVVDGEEVSADAFDTFTQKPVEAISTLELTTITEDDVLLSFKDIATRFGELIEAMKLISLQFQNGQDKKALVTVTQLADTVDYFCKATALSTLFPEKFADMNIDGVAIQDFFGDFMAILTDFEEAFKNSDSVMLGDLAEYEITPRIESIISMIDSI